MIDVMETVRRFVGGCVWDDSYDETSIREELGRLAKNAKTRGELDMGAALELWPAERARRYPEPPAEDAG